MSLSKITYTVSFLIKLALMLVLLSSLSCCDVMEDVAGASLGIEETPEGDPPRENQSDENSTQYNPPELNLRCTPDIADGATLPDHQITYSWNPVDYDSTRDVVVKYRLDGFTDWSEWMGEQQVTYQYLDERSYSFEIEAKYDGKDTTEFTFSHRFTVNSLEGPSITFTPRRKLNLTQGDTFEVDIVLHEVTDVNSLKAVIAFDHTLLTLTESTINSAENNFMSPEGHSIVSLTGPEEVNGQLVINITNLDNQHPEVSGTGAIGKLKFRVQSSTATNTSITFGNASRLRDAGNNALEIESLVPKLLQLNTAMASE